MKTGTRQNRSTRRAGPPTVEVLETKAKGLLKEAFVQVREAATNDPGGKLFPNGIDLIYVRLEGGAGAARVAVEVKLAGPVKASG